MSFIFKCSHCGADLEGEDEWRGMQTECPICKHETDIPLPAPVNDQKTNQPPRMNLGRGKTTEPSDSRSQFASPRNNPASSPGPISGPVSEAEEKECPFCGETIRYKAKVCRFCLRTLPGVPTFGPIADVPRGPYPGAPRGPYGNPPPQAPYGNPYSGNPYGPYGNLPPQGPYGNPYSAAGAQDDDEVVGDLPPKAGLFSGICVVYWVLVAFVSSFFVGGKI